MWLIEDRFRYVLLAIGFLCLTSIASNYIIINFTFICMKEDLTDGILNSNGTLISRYDYTPTEKSSIIWAVAAGTIIGTPPVNYAYIKYGARCLLSPPKYHFRWPFFIAGCLSVLSTILVPITAGFGMLALLVVRFIQGVAYSADFAAIGIMCVRWAPLRQTGLFIAVLTSFTPVSSVITNPLTGALCGSTLGWRSSYYIHAAFGAVVFSLWFIFYKDDPHLHPLVTKIELSTIQKDKTKAHIERDSFVPFWQIIKNPVILVVWANAFVEMVSVTLLLTYAPLYYHNVLRYDIPTTGLLVSIAASSHVPLKIIMGILSDYMGCLSEKAKMCLYNSVAVGMAGVFCGLIGLTPASQPGLVVVFFAAVYASMGMNPGGFYKCGTFVSRQYAHFVLATIQFMKCVALFVAPGIVAIFVRDEHSFDEWSWAYLTNAILLILANCAFYFVVTDKPAKFTEITRETKRKRSQVTPTTIRVQEQESA